MSRKPKFNPEITRVKLNPEQAVLACCYDTGRTGTGGNLPGSGLCDAAGSRSYKTKDTFVGSIAVS